MCFSGWMFVHMHIAAYNLELNQNRLPVSCGFWFHLWTLFFSGISTVEDFVDAVCGGITSLNSPSPLFGSNKWLLHVTTNTHHVPCVWMFQRKSDQTGKAGHADQLAVDRERGILSDWQDFVVKTYRRNGPDQPQWLQREQEDEEALEVKLIQAVSHIVGSL